VARQLARRGIAGEGCSRPPLGAQLPTQGELSVEQRMTNGLEESLPTIVLCRAPATGSCGPRWRHEIR
jgi:hypothetical protein